MISGSTHKNANSQAWVFLAACVAGIFVFYPTVLDMFSMWWEAGSAYSHGLLLVLIVFYFFFKQWNNEKAVLNIRPKIWMLPIILALSMIWMIAYLSQIQALEQLVLLLVLVSIIIALLGPARAVPYIYAIALMIFTISSWSQINGLLKMATAVASGNLLDLTGVTSVREGFFILIPAGTFEVTNGCSGLRYQLAGLSISLLYAYMEKLSFWKTLLYLLVAFVVIFFANVIRIYIVILAGQITNMQSSLMDDHLWLGWVVFTIFMSIFLYFSNSLISQSGQSESDQMGASTDKGDASLSSKWVFTIVMLGVTASGPLLARYYTPAADNLKVRHEIELPDMLNAWKFSSIPAQYQTWRPGYISPDVVASGRYTDIDGESARSVDYYMIIYSYQTQGHEAININNRVYNKKKWALINKRKKEIELADDVGIVVNEFEIRDRQGHSRLVWMWYYVDGKNLAGKYRTKLASLVSVFKQRPEISVNVISVPVLSEPGPAREALTDFLNNGLQEINALFDGWL